MSIGTEIILILLPIVSSVCTVLTFFITRGKDHHREGEWQGKLQSDISHIKDAISEYKKMNGQYRDLSERVAVNENEVKSLQKRTDANEAAVNNLSTRIDNIVKT